MSMDSKEMVELCLKHSLFSWSATGKVDPIPVARAEGIYLYTPEGKRIIDFNSQLMSVNIGHGHPHVIKAIQDQAATLSFAGPSMATEIRARLSKRLAELAPTHEGVTRCAHRSTTRSPSSIAIPLR
jgi:taurine--2-oxoglutarate transaminase